MGKTTNNKDDKFGGPWTREKLIIIEEYLKSYLKVLKNCQFSNLTFDSASVYEFVETAPP